MSKKRITLSNSTHMMNMTDPLAISMETPKINNRCSLEKELIELIGMNP